MMHLVNTVLKHFDLALVRRTQLVEALLDRRVRNVPVTVDRRRAIAAR
ncbi:MAG: hypothetical protein JWO22_831 [Frankiales bacterium]|nr:hypothetical protein [Frankiales bacterium]